MEPPMYIPTGTVRKLTPTGRTTIEFDGKFF